MYALQYGIALIPTISQLGLDVTYEAAFATRSNPISLSNLHYERCATLYNLAARYSQLAMAEDRSKPEGVKQANGYYQVSGTVHANYHHGLSDTNIPNALTSVF